MLPSLAPAWFYPTPTQCSRSGMGKNEVSFVISKFDICLTKCTQDGNHSVTQKKCLHSDCSYPDEIIQAKGALGRPSTLATEGQEGYQGENQKPWCLWWLSWQTCGKQCFLSHFSCLWLVTETTHTHTGSNAAIYRNHKPSLFLVRSWDPSFVHLSRKLLFNSPNRLMISPLPFLKLIKSIFYKHDANLKHHQITLWIHIENIF